MHWYLARRLIAIRVAGRLLDVEEEFFVVDASSLRQARRDAKRAYDDEPAYKNIYGQDVTWRFHTLLDVVDLGIARFRDGMWLHRRDFPRSSRLHERPHERIHADSRALRKSRDEAWYGAMVLFRTRERPVHDIERLLLFRAVGWKHAPRKALVLGKRAADRWQEDLVGVFEAHHLSDNSIKSEGEVYWRFFQPGVLKHTDKLPRQQYLTVPLRSGSGKRGPA